MHADLGGEWTNPCAGKDSNAITSSTIGIMVEVVLWVAEVAADNKRQVMQWLAQLADEE